MFFGFAVIGYAPSALAAAYGVGGYSSCGYQGCSRQHTTTTTPGGLRVAINLADGQHIPASGYTITVTPLNGQGDSFRQAAFLVNDHLAHTAIPNETGTAQWLWKPRDLPGNRLTITVTDTQGEHTTQDFSVVVDAVTQTTLHTAATDQQPTNALNRALQQAYHGAQQAVQALPPSVAYSIPYALLVLLGLNVFLLALQAKRELREYHTLRQLLSRNRAMNDAKKTLLQLASHYLRTPLTVLQGGIELLTKDTPTSTPLQNTTRHMQENIEQLIARTAAVQQPTAATFLQPRLWWRQPALLVPIFLIAVLVVLFNMLATHTHTVSLGNGNGVAQGVLFLILVLATWQVFRRRQLRQRDRRELQQLAADEAATNHARDALITNTTTALENDLATLDGLVTQLDTSRAAQLVRTAQARFHTVLDTFATAKQLRGGHAVGPFATATVVALWEPHREQLQALAQQRGVTISLKGDVPLRAQQPQLVGQALATLIDNAIAYSPSGGEVIIDAAARAGGATIIVRDHGSGIPADKLSLLFQPFSRAEGAEVFTREGMGFSLYLDKLIMAYLGGDLSLASTPGVGTTATIRLA
jgi:signal transduction histidine kinase